MGNVVALQGESHKDTETVGYLCGKLIHLDSRTAGGHGATLDRTSPLPNVAIRLYRRESSPCCGTLEVQGKTKTGTGGEFAFADAKPGAYWLLATVGGREFKLRLRLVRPTATSTACQNQDFEIEDSGKFWIMRMAGYL
jgi:hypothetical protein